MALCFSAPGEHDWNLSHSLEILIMTSLPNTIIMTILVFVLQFCKSEDNFLIGFLLNSVMGMLCITSGIYVLHYLMNNDSWLVTIGVLSEICGFALIIENIFNCKYTFYS